MLNFNLNHWWKDFVGAFRRAHCLSRPYAFYRYLAFQITPDNIIYSINGIQQSLLGLLDRYEPNGLMSSYHVIIKNQYYVDLPSRLIISTYLVGTETIDAVFLTFEAVFDPLSCLL